MSENTISEVSEGIYRLSANVDNILFEGIWPIPHGVAMNSYIVKGDKVAIVDGVCEWDGVPETLFSQLEKMQVHINDIDYVILNHLEPDHTGWLNAFKKLRSEFTIVTSKKGAKIAEAFYGITENILTVSDGDEIDLGQGRVLRFYEIPNVHWPETIATYDTRSCTLFPCDAFGSYGSVQSSAPYDDMLSQEEIDFFEDEALRYYANIVAAFSIPTKKAIDKLGPLEIKAIAPGHGIVWRRNPAKIVTDYIRYAGYSKGPAKEHVTVIYGSMYGMTEQGIKPVVEGLESEGITVHLHRIPESNISFVLKDVWQSTGVVLAMPTYEYKMFPPMAAVLDEIGKKKVLNRLAFRFGSYGWSGGAQKELDEITSRLKMNWQFIDPVEFNGAPSSDELDMIRLRGAELGRLVKESVLNAAN
ncbi:FprA family A-type flavoprotein [Spirochaeta dissipatitropha]